MIDKSSPLGRRLRLTGEWLSGRMHGMVAMGRKALAGRIEPSSPHWTAAAGKRTAVRDALGRRVSKTVNGVTRVYINNADWQEVAEYQGTAGFQPASGPRLKSRSGQGCPRSLAAGILPALVQSYVFGTYIDEVLLPCRRSSRPRAPRMRGRIEARARSISEGDL